METVLVSVIIPFYERSEWLIEALESAISQSYNNYEIIVINDGSKEDISVIIKKFGELINYVYKDNEGPAAARNLGIELAKGKYIAFLDSDDLWNQVKLEKQVKIMEEKGATWSHTNYSTFNNCNSNNIIKELNLSYFQGNIFPRCLASTPIATPCVMVRSQFLKDNPLIRFKEDMRYGQDLYFWIILSKLAPLWVIPESLSKIRIRGSNAALRARVQIKARAQIWKFIKYDPDFLVDIKELSIILSLGYKLCYIGNNFVDFLESKGISNTKVLEIVSRIVYLTPYLIFKLLDKYFKLCSNVKRGY